MVWQGLKNKPKLACMNLISHFLNPAFFFFFFSSKLFYVSPTWFQKNNGSKKFTWKIIERQKVNLEYDAIKQNLISKIMLEINVPWTFFYKFLLIQRCRITLRWFLYLLFMHPVRKYVFVCYIFQSINFCKVLLFVFLYLRYFEKGRTRFINFIKLFFVVDSPHWRVYHGEWWDKARETHFRIISLTEIIQTWNSFMNYRYHKLFKKSRSALLAAKQNTLATGTSMSKKQSTYVIWLHVY